MQDAASSSDIDLMRRTTAGDRDAFATLYQTHHATVYRFARLMTGSTAIAEDIVQEVFLALMRDASRYDPARASLTTYLYGSARHHTRRRLLATAFSCGSRIRPTCVCQRPQLRLLRISSDNATCSTCDARSSGCRLAIAR
jgi:hypothetical protein